MSSHKIIFISLVLSTLVSSIASAAILDDLVEKIKHESALHSHHKKHHKKYHRKHHAYHSLRQEAQWQTALHFLGYYDGKINGDMLTQRSFAAIIAFHRANKEIETGFLEEEDKRYLSKVYRLIRRERYLSYKGKNRKKQNRRLQAALSEEGFYNNKIDGLFKKHSKAAWRRYKSQYDGHMTDTDELKRQLIENARKQVKEKLETIKKEPYNPTDYAEKRGKGGEM